MARTAIFVASKGSLQINEALLLPIKTSLLLLLYTPSMSNERFILNTYVHILITVALNRTQRAHPQQCSIKACHD